MSIIRRAPNLLLGLALVAFNIVVAENVMGFSPDKTQVTIANIVFGAVIAVVAIREQYA